ncbi:unnamed protein product [Linum tenue]|uniref:Uncharacterized protein n=1 Tax=Linum tenue TaxID=586396 RepID=A0AAV0JCP2_9ROSI|nr:unnamed protein product [Linum tenue]
MESSVGLVTWTEVGKCSCTRNLSLVSWVNIEPIGWLVDPLYTMQDALLFGPKTPLKPHVHCGVLYQEG